MSLDTGPKEDCNGVLTMPRKDQHESWTPEGQTQSIKDAITTGISNRVITLKKNLSEKFQTTGQLTYPGYGTFAFSDPAVGNTGEILATIAFKDVTKKIDVPPPYVPVLHRMQGAPFLAVPTHAPCVAPVTKLSWSFSRPVKGASHCVEILINGKNQSDEAICLVGAAFTVSSQPKGRGLVTHKHFKSDKWTIGKPDETQCNVFQIVVDTDGTPAFTSVTAEAGETDHLGITPITFSGAGDVTIEPGRTLTLALLTGTGMPNKYPVSVIEEWPERKERESHSLENELSAILSP